MVGTIKMMSFKNDSHGRSLMKSPKQPQSLTALIYEGDATPAKEANH
jgi:hypothetical protein